MKTLNLLIVDDERSARDLIKSLLEGIEWIQIMGEAASVDEAMQSILKYRPDAILLDIQMPRKDGFVLIENMLNHKIQAEIIFITAYEKYAIRAVKSSAFDYLLKPVKKQVLIDSLNRALEKISTTKFEEHFTDLLNQLREQKKLKFKNRTGFSMIDANEIIYCQADSNYSVLELESGKNKLVSMNLGKIEEMLPPGNFCRISRSLIVNIKYISHVNRKAMICELVHSGSPKLAISRKYLPLLEQSCNTLIKY